MSTNRQIGAALRCLLALGVAAGCAPSAADDDDRTPAEPLADHEELTTDVPDPRKVKSTVKGTGCGAIKYVHASNNQSFNVMTSNPDGLLLGAGEASCTATVHYDFPAGWTLSAPRPIATGAVLSGDSTKVTMTLTSTLLGQRWTATQSFTGYTNDNFHLVIDERHSERGGLVPCGATSADLTFRVTAKLTGGDGKDVVHLDDIHTALDWRRCE